MDPFSTSSRVASRWLPRTRGDGPAAAVIRAAPMAASPHTRGWTPVASTRTGSGGAGFPAHAGMDLGSTARGWRGAGLPRTRGDGPLDDVTDLDEDAASPHTRGWTHPEPLHALVAGGFPAHAGMDPAGKAHQSRAGRLPRTRGDGPLPLVDDELPCGASPHTRGWTFDGLCKPHLPHGFPAHAGMDLAHVGLPSAGLGLPRTRGDGPRRSADLQNPRRASPHTRGWTPAAGDRCPDGRGFPAHAGMDPSPSPSCRPKKWLPRTRGDGPHVETSSIGALTASPHTRGWTPSRSLTTSLASGFPAHAGMDPRGRSRARGPRRLPRTRGDGP